MVADRTIFALGEGISYQPLGAGEGAVVLTISSGQLYTCNDTTAAFLGLMDGARTFGDLVDGLHRTFEVPHDELRRDLGRPGRGLDGEGPFARNSLRPRSHGGHRDNRWHQGVGPAGFAAAPASALPRVASAVGQALASCRLPTRADTAARSGAYAGHRPLPGACRGLHRQACQAHLPQAVGDARPALPQRGAARLPLPVAGRLRAEAVLRRGPERHQQGARERALLGRCGGGDRPQSTFTRHGRDFSLWHRRGRDAATPDRGAV